MTVLETRDDLLTVVPQNAVIAELGVFTGDFSNTILRVCNPAELHLVDSWTGDMSRGDKDGENVQVVNDLALVYLALALRGDARYTLHRGTTQEAFQKFPDYYFDFIYVSADSEHAVYDNLLLAMKKSLWGIGGHDYRDGTGVMRAVNMFCGDYDWKITHLTRDKRPSYLLRPR